MLSCIKALFKEWLQTVANSSIALFFFSSLREGQFFLFWSFFSELLKTSNLHGWCNFFSMSFIVSSEFLQKSDFRGCLEDISVENL